MAQYTVDVEEYAALLTRTYVPRFPRDNRPRTITDTTEKGETVLEFLLPHPEDGRFSVSLQVHTRQGSVSDCSLRFGQAEVAVKLAPDEAIDAIEEIIGDRIVAIVRYKNRDAYENHRKVSTSPIEWLYQMPDHEEALDAMQKKLKTPASFWEKLSGSYTGVFEIYRWSGSEVVER